MVIEPAAPECGERVASSFEADLVASTDSRPGSTLVVVRGRLRASTTRVVREAVEEALAAAPAAIVLDLADVVADDELGLWVVPALAGDAAGRGVGFTVVAPTRSLRMRLRRLGARPVEITETVPDR